MFENNENGLRMFVASMKLFIEKHESEKEDSWVRCDIDYLEDNLQHEIYEYNTAKTHDGKTKELVDIANMCMMLYHRHIEERNIEDDFDRNRPHIKNMFFR